MTRGFRVNKGYARLAGVVCASELRFGAVLVLAVLFVASVVAVVLALAAPPLRDAAPVRTAEVRGRTLDVGCRRMHNVHELKWCMNKHGDVTNRILPARLRLSDNRSHHHNATSSEYTCNAHTSSSIVSTR